MDNIRRDKILCARCKIETLQEFVGKVPIHRNQIIVEKYICTVCQRKNQVVHRMRNRFP
jgi:hypothetical protein